MSMGLKEILSSDGTVATVKGCWRYLAAAGAARCWSLQCTGSMGLACKVGWDMMQSSLGRTGYWGEDDTRPIGKLAGNRLRLPVPVLVRASNDTVPDAAASCHCWCFRPSRSQAQDNCQDICRNLAVASTPAQSGTITSAPSARLLVQVHNTSRSQELGFISARRPKEWLQGEAKIAAKC